MGPSPHSLPCRNISPHAKQLTAKTMQGTISRGLSVRPAERAAQQRTREALVHQASDIACAQRSEALALSAKQKADAGRERRQLRRLRFHHPRRSRTCLVLRGWLLLLRHARDR